MCAQNPVLPPWRRVQRAALLNVELLRGKATASEREDAALILTALGLSDALNKFPSELSGGMAHRLGLAQALIQRAQTTLLDEPLSGTDLLMRTQISILLRKRLSSKPGLTTLVVTHDIDDAVLIADRVIALVVRPAKVGFDRKISIVRPTEVSDVFAFRSTPEVRQLSDELSAFLLAPGEGKEVA